MSEYDHMNYPCQVAVRYDTMTFVVTFCLSVLSATFGVAKFIKSGPARVIDNEKCLMGFCSATFILLFLNIAATLVGRGVVIGFYLGGMFHWSNNKINIILVFLCFVPQLLHVSYCNLTWNKHFEISFDLFAGFSHSLPCPWL